MKKILSAIALTAALGTQVNAQVFTLEYQHNSEDTIVTNGSVLDVKPTIKLNLEPGIDSFTYKWQFTEFSLPSDWDAQGLCDNVICHPYKVGGVVNDYFKTPFAESPVSAWTLNDTNALTPSDLIYVWLQVEPGDTNGFGVFKYKIITETVHPLSAQPANPQEVEVVHIVHKDGGVSVNTITIPENAIRLYPNPATGVLNVDIASDLKVTTAKVVDMQGKVILTAPMNGKSIDIQHLNSGMYAVDFLNADGVKLTTRKFVKQ